MGGAQDGGGRLACRPLPGAPPRAIAPPCPHPERRAEGQPRSLCPPPAPPPRSTDSVKMATRATRGVAILGRRTASGRALPQAECQQEHVTRHRPTTPGLGQGDHASPRGGVAILNAADSRAPGDAAPQGSPPREKTPGVFSLPRPALIVREVCASWPPLARYSHRDGRYTTCSVSAPPGKAGAGRPRGGLAARVAFAGVRLRDAGHEGKG